MFWVEESTDRKVEVEVVAWKARALMEIENGVEWKVSGQWKKSRGREECLLCRGGLLIGEMGRLSGRLDRDRDLDEREVRLLRDQGSRRGR